MRERQPLRGRVRNRPRGDSFVNCLAGVVLFFGGLTWAYFHFVQNRNLENPLEGHNIVEHANAEVTNIYRTKMIRESFARAQTAQKKMLDLYKICKKEGYTPGEEFTQESHEIEAILRETINDMKLKTVPKSFEKAHLQLAECVATYYKALTTLEEMVYAETPGIREDKRKEFNEKYKKAVGLWKKSRAKYGKL